MATGDVHFESVWSNTGANLATTDPYTRGLAVASSVTTGAAQAWHWTDDGTKTGSDIYSTDPDACPFPVAVMSDGVGYSMTGCYGPIMSPSDNNARSLYSWLLQYVVASTCWKMTVYAGGVDGEGGVGHLDDSGRGRSMSALIVTG